VKNRFAVETVLSAMVTGFGYAFLGAAVLAGIGQVLQSSREGVLFSVFRVISRRPDFL